MRRLEKEIPRMLRIERKESGYAVFFLTKGLLVCDFLYLNF